MRRLVAVLVALGLTGCNLVFGLEAPAGDDDDVDPGDGGTVDRSGGDGGSQFGNPIALTVAGPQALAVGELDDRTGKDLAIAGAAGLTILSCGPQRSCDQKLMGTGLMPTSVVVLDANADDLADIAVVASGSQTIDLFLGKGKGDYSSNGSLPDITPLLVVAGSFFGVDTAPDLLVSRQNSPIARLFVNNLSGSFSANAIVTAPANLTAIATGFLDADLNTDVVLSTTAGVQAYRVNRLTGGVTTLGPAFSGSASAILTVDINLDQFTDLVLAQASVLQVWLGDGEGGFAPTPTINIDSGRQALAAGWVDGDAIPDLVVASRDTGIVRIFHRDPDGNVNPGPSFEHPGDPSGVALADLDGDGRDDLVILQALSGTVLVYFAD